MNRRDYPSFYAKAKDKCVEKPTKLERSSCIKREFFKQCKNSDCHDVSTHPITGVPSRSSSRLDQVKRQRGAHVTTYLLLDGTYMRCEGASKQDPAFEGASCLPTISGHGRRSIDDFIQDPNWPPQLPMAPSGKTGRDQNERCLLRLALLKDQMGPRIRMYWSTGKYHNFGTKKTVELKKSFFTDGKDKWLEKYLKDKSKLGRRIVDGITTPAQNKMLGQIRR